MSAQNCVKPKCFPNARYSSYPQGLSDLMLKQLLHYQKEVNRQNVTLVTVTLNGSDEKQLKNPNRLLNKNIWLTKLPPFELKKILF